MSLKRCVISLATNTKRFPEALARLERSLHKTGFEGGFVCWPPGRFPAGCPSHREVPFAFKPYCFMEARRGGFDSVLWLDSSCVVVGSLEPIFAQIEEDGYVLFRNRHHTLGQWSSDVTLALFDLSREKAMEIPEVNAAALGLSMRDPVGLEFLEGWFAAASHGVAFRGVAEELTSDDAYFAVKRNERGRVSRDPRVRGHRHDQTVAGILGHQLGMKHSTEGLVTKQERGHGRRGGPIVIDRLPVQSAPKRLWRRLRA